jgi:hypothetical protein
VVWGEMGRTDYGLYFSGLRNIRLDFSESEKYGANLVTTLVFPLGANPKDTPAVSPLFFYPQSPNPTSINPFIITHYSKMYFILFQYKITL